MSVLVTGPDEKDLTKLNHVLRQLAEGRSNAVGSCTLAISTTTTTVTAPNCGTGSTVILTPTTAHAAAEFGNGTIYVSAVANGTFTITHASNTQNDRTFLWAAFG